MTSRPVTVFLAIALLATVVTGATAPPTGATSPRPASTTCARFGAMRDALAAMGSATTPKQTFARLAAATKAFRAAVRAAPVAIADDMKVLSASLADLERRVRPLRRKLHVTRSASKYDAMVEPIQRAFTAWAKHQDTTRLDAAQDHVQQWLTEHCGIVLGPTGTTSPAATP